MGCAYLMQVQIGPLDSVADPGSPRIAARTGAFADHGGESGVAGDFENTFAQNLRQRARTVKAVQRQDRAAARFDPENLGILARIRHREQAGAIGHEQHIGFDRRRRGGSVHGNSFYGPLRHACHLAVLRLERDPPAGV